MSPSGIRKLVYQGTYRCNGMHEGRCDYGSVSRKKLDTALCTRLFSRLSQLYDSTIDQTKIADLNRRLQAIDNELQTLTETLLELPKITQIRDALAEKQREKESIQAELKRALSSLRETITIGGKFQQAHTMGIVAYGDEAENTRMTQKADTISRGYVLDPLLTREQMAQMRMTMPDNFSNDKIAELFENESVFAHTTGMSPDAVGRLNYAFQQIATSAHLMGQDFLQVVNASSALIKGLQKLHGFTSSS